MWSLRPAVVEIKYDKIMNKRLKIFSSLVPLILFTNWLSYSIVSENYSSNDDIPEQDKEVFQQKLDSALTCLKSVCGKMD